MEYTYPTLDELPVVIADIRSMVKIMIDAGSTFNKAIRVWAAVNGLYLHIDSVEEREGYYTLNNDGGSFDTNTGDLCLRFVHTSQNIYHDIYIDVPIDGAPAFHFHPEPGDSHPVDIDKLYFIHQYRATEKYGTLPQLFREGYAISLPDLDERVHLSLYNKDHINQSLVELGEVWIDVVGILDTLTRTRFVYASEKVKGVEALTKEKLHEIITTNFPSHCKVEYIKMSKYSIVEEILYRG